MAIGWLRCAFLVVLSHQYFVSGSSFDRVLDDVQSCKESCDQTYPLHTYSNSKHSECCKRGCRFFSLVEFAHDGHDPNPNVTKEACTESCMEAYSQTGDRYACNIGCANQVPFSMEQQSKEKQKPQSMHLVTPLMYVHNIYNNIFDRMSRIMSVSWSFYRQDEDGKVFIVKTSPEILTEYLDVDEINDEKSQDDLASDSKYDQLQLEKSSPELHLHVVPDTYAYGQSQDAAFGLPQHKDVAGSTYSIATNNEIITTNADWLGCMARKSGLPRWLIGLTILFSALTMIWLCLTTAATAPEHHIRSQKVNVHDNIEYLRLHNTQEKVRIQPPCEHEASPLPVKISLQNLL